MCQSCQKYGSKNLTILFSKGYHKITFAFIHQKSLILFRNKHGESRCSITCEEKMKYPEVPCSLNSVDVGIAIGSACAIAADARVDTRVMFSAGRVAQELGWMPDCSNVYGIPVSCSSKNPFFDRQSTRPK